MTAARLAGGVVHWLARCLAVLLIVAVLGVALLAIRLSQGPVDVAWAVRAVLARSGGQQVSIGQATLRWAGFHEGAGSPIRLVMRDLRVSAADGSPRLTVAEGETSISTAGLLTGEVLPRTAELRGARLSARRDASGDWQLDLGENGGDAGGVDATRAELTRPPSNDQDAGTGGHALRQLRRLSLHDATIDVLDARFGAWRLSNADVELTRKPGGGLEGQADLDATLADAAAGRAVATHLSAHATLGPGGRSRVELTASAVNPSVLARASPAFGQVALLDAAVALSAAVELDPSGAPGSATLMATIGAGQVQLPSSTLRFDSLGLRGELAWVDGSPAQLRSGRIDAVLPSPSGGWPTTLTLTGSGERKDGRLKGDMTIDLDHVAFADLDGLWPRGVGVHARDWIIPNITGGIGRAAHMEFGLDAPDDGSDVQLTRAAGRMTAENVSVFWLKPVPPVEHLNAQLNMIDPDTMDVTVDPAAGVPRQGRLTIPGGTIRISGLAGTHQVAQINLDISGTVADTIALLRHPRLKLLSRHPQPIQSAAGAMSGKLGVRVPLENNLDFDTIAITAATRLTDLKLSGIVGGRDLTQGSVQLDATNDGMKVHGRATVAGLPGRLGVEMDFRAGGPDQLLQSVSFDSQPDVAQLAAAGLGASGMLTGAPVIDVSYTARRSGMAEVQAHANLTAAGVNVLGWRKAPGQPATLRARVVLDHDKLVGIDSLHAEGPGLRIEGRTEVQAGRPVALVVEQAQLGQTRASGAVRFGTPLRIEASGPLLDASSLLKGMGDGSSGARSADGMAYVADARFAEVLLGPDRRLSGVVVHAENDGRHLQRATLEVAGPDRLSASVTPGEGGRALRVHAADGGGLLRLLDVTEAVQGGALMVNGVFDDRAPNAPLSGTLEMETFHVRQAPAIGKILQALTLYGLFDALRGPGLVFDKLIVRFRSAGDVLDLSHGRAFSASLGITAEGRLDFGRHAADLRGTVVPAYALNSALGRLPIIGRVFSAEPAGGLVAANYTVRGALANPDMSVNPLSALAPGILRRLFNAID